MPGNPTKLGPFTGGLNNKSQTGEAKADELVEMLNFEVTTDEAVTSRPPIELIKGTYRTSLLTAANWKVLCVFRRSPSEWYLIVSEPVVDAGIDKVKVNAYLNGNLASAPIEVEPATTAENEVSDAVQFADEVFFIRDITSSSPGFKWGPLSPYEQLTSMPRGKVIVSWKSRLWIAGRTDSSGLGAQLRYSHIEPTGPEPHTWRVEDYVDVAYGEGGFITSIIPLQNNLVIFKSDGTWRFSYPSQVKDGSVDVLSSSIGAASRHSAVELENIVYLYDQGSVYEMVNSTFTKINSTVELREDQNSINTPIDDVEISIVNRRIVIRYSNAIYALNIETKAWSQWRSYTGTPGRFIELPAESSSSSSPVYISSSCGTAIREEIFVRDFNSVTSKFGTYSLLESGNSLVLPPLESVQFSAPYTEDDNAAQTFNIPVSIDQELQLSFTKITGDGDPVVTFEGLEASGVVSPISITPTIVSSVYTFKKKLNSGVSSDGTAFLAVRIRISNDMPNSQTISNIRIQRNASPATAVLYRLVDDYSESAASKEIIFCKIKTRGTDFGSPQTWKRLHWWGLDLKTYFETVAVAVPSSKEPKVFWREIDAYTNNQLLQGTYRNPLNWLLRSVSIFNRHEPEYDISEDGRFFKKLAKALRFQRISFEYETKTHGTASTGPAKLFTITPMVKDKRVVIDTNT